MTTPKTIANLACLLAACLLFLATCARAQTFGEDKLVYEWTWLDFEWPSESAKNESIKDGSYVPKRSLIAGIKVYKDDVYLTIPRWLWTSGHPVTLAKVVTVQGQTKLRPYPSWAAQKQGDCDALQYVQSMEIDPNTGYMYVIDSGRVGGKLNICPAKIVVYDLNTDTEVDRYEMPTEVFSESKHLLNDIVLDYVDGQVKYAYITNPNEERIVVYNFEKRSAHFLEDPSMKAEEIQGSLLTINDKAYNFSVAINGIAMSPDFRYVYFSILGGYNLYQVPTSVLRSGSASDSTSFRLVGRKISQTAGLAHGSKHLFYGALGLSSVYYWDSDKDMTDQNVSVDKVTLATQVELVRNKVTMQWIESLGFDERGWIWFVSNRFQELYGSAGIPAGSKPSMRVWKVYVNETSYLHQANERTRKGNGGSAVRPLLGLSGSGLCLAAISFLVTTLVSQRMAFM